MNTPCRIILPKHIKFDNDTKSSTSDWWIFFRNYLFDVTKRSLQKLIYYKTISDIQKKAYTLMEHQYFHIWLNRHEKFEVQKKTSIRSVQCLWYIYQVIWTLTYSSYYLQKYNKTGNTVLKINILQNKHSCFVYFFITYYLKLKNFKKNVNKTLCLPFSCSVSSLKTLCKKIHHKNTIYKKKISYHLKYLHASCEKTK